MLQAFRHRGLSNVIYAVIIIATVFIFVIQFNPSAGKKTASCNQACTATVRGWCIEQKHYRAAQLMLMPQGREIPASQMAEIRRIALDGLIERELLVSEAERIGLTASDGEVTDQLFAGWVRVVVPSDDPSVGPRADTLAAVGFKDPKTKEFDLKTYDRMVRNMTHLSTNEFREEQRRALLADKVRDIVRTNVRISDAEAYAGYVAQYNTATVEYVDVKESWVARWMARPTDAEVAAWTKDHQADVDKEFESRKAEDLPKDGRVRHILAQFNDSHGQKPPTPEERAAALAKISAVAARVKAGESFAELARTETDDPGSKSKGGGYDKEELGGMVAPFKKEADALQPGEVSPGVVETQFGFHLMMKDDPAKAADVEARVKKSIARELLTKERAAARAKEIVGYILADMKAGKSAEDAVAAHVGSLDASAAPPVTPVKVLNEGENPQPAPDASDAGAPAADAAADATAPKPAQTADKNKDKGPLAAWKPLTASTDPDRPRARTSSPFNEQADPPEGFAASAGPALMKFAFSAKDGDVLDEPLAGSDGLIAVQLKERHTTSPEDYAKARDVYVQGLLQKKQAEALALYVKQLRKTAEKANEIKLDKSTLETGDGGAAPAEPVDDEGM